MSKNPKLRARMDAGLVEVKCKFDAEFRRFSVDPQRASRFDEFCKTIEAVHRISDTPFVLTYTDQHGDLLPINNDDNYQRAVITAKPILRVFIQRKGESYGEINGYGTVERKKKNPISKLIVGSTEVKMRTNIAISLPEDFRRVSAIIDVDIVPETHRRVKLMKNGTDKPLGFYIRDGTSVRVTSHGLEKVPGIFISRLVPGGLAESTGLLAVNDEVLEVNGIEVAGKTLDQVTDMMVANSANLIVTVKPVNQRNNIHPVRGGSGRGSQKSTSAGSLQSAQSFDSDEINEVHEDDEDVVKDLTTPTDVNHPPIPEQLAAAAAAAQAMSASATGIGNSGSSPAGGASFGATSGDLRQHHQEAVTSDADKDRDSAVVTL